MKYPSSSSSSSSNPLSCTDHSLSDKNRVINLVVTQLNGHTCRTLAHPEQANGGKKQK